MKYAIGILALMVVVLGLVAFAPRLPEPTVVSGSAVKSAGPSGFCCTFRIFRTWSDGRVDVTWVVFDNENPCDQPLPPCGPVVLLP